MTKTNMIKLEFPLWVQIICYVVIAIFVIAAIRGIYINYLKTAFGKRRVVKARLVSKVEEEYRELKAYQSRGSGIKSPEGPVYMSKKGIAYRLYFDVEGKTVELDVTKEIFDSLKEDTIGMLDYKGNYFNEFVV